eukprot:3934159-Rhodomonas_salina.6
MVSKTDKPRALHGPCPKVLARSGEGPTPLPPTQSLALDLAPVLPRRSRCLLWMCGRCAALSRRNAWSRRRQQPSIAGLSLALCLQSRQRHAGATCRTECGIRESESGFEEARYLAPLAERCTWSVPSWCSRCIRRYGSEPARYTALATNWLECGSVSSLRDRTLTSMLNKFPLDDATDVTLNLVAVTASECDGASCLSARCSFSNKAETSLARSAGNEASSPSRSAGSTSTTNRMPTPFPALISGGASRSCRIRHPLRSSAECTRPGRSGGVGGASRLDGDGSQSNER